MNDERFLGCRFSNPLVDDDVEQAQSTVVNRLWDDLVHLWRVKGDEQLAKALKKEPRPIGLQRFQYLFLASVLHNDRCDAALAGPAQWPTWIAQRRSLCINERQFLLAFAALAKDGATSSWVDFSRQALDLLRRFPGLLREPLGTGIAARCQSSLFAVARALQ